MGRKSVETPNGLGKGGRQLWDAVTAIGPLRADRLRLLEEAAFAADLIDRLRAELQDGPTTTRGAAGQVVAHPTVSEVRQHQQTLRALLNALDLPVDDSHQTADAMAARESAMALARHRWSKGTATA